MEKLTKAEEEVMQHIWELGRCTVSQILEKIGDPHPPHSTISSIVRILEKKGFVDHKAYGRTYEYFPMIERETYSKKSLKKLVSNYFSGSADQLVSFLVKEKELSLKELGEILKKLEKDQNDV